MKSFGDEDLVLGAIAGKVGVAGGARHGVGAFLPSDGPSIDLIRVRIAERARKVRLSNR